VVYRQGDELRAYPSVAKVNRCTFDPANPTRESLLNNITTSASETKQSGLDFILPLCRQESLDTLGITQAELQVASKGAAGGCLTLGVALASGHDVLAGCAMSSCNCVGMG
jgi:hypothetical protein